MRERYKRPPYVTRQSRRGLFFLFLLALFSLVSAGILKVDFISSPEGQLTWTYLLAVFVVSVATAMHVFYLLVVINVTVLEDSSFPIGRHARAKRQLAAFLAVAYSLPLLLSMLVAVWEAVGGDKTFSVAFLSANSSTQKIVVLCAFLLLYGVWIYVDISEWRDAEADAKMANERVREQLLVWIAIEGVTILIIVYSLLAIGVESPNECAKFVVRDACLSLTERWDIFGNKLHLLDPKDYFVALCVGGFIYQFSRHNSMPISESYVGTYERYTELCRLDGFVSARDDAEMIPLVRKEIIERIDRNATIWDFGAGNGQRLQELLINFAELNKSQVSRLPILSIDRNSDWKSRQLWTDPAKRFATTAPPREQFHILHLSHVLYEERALRDAERIIRNHATEGALIVIRGAAASSPFYVVGLARASRLIDFHPHHHWVELYLRELVDRTGLVPIASFREPVAGRYQPDLRVMQRVSIERNGDTLAALMGVIFSRSARGPLESALSALAECGVSSLQNDDMIWVFKAPGKRDA